MKTAGHRMTASSTHRRIFAAYKRRFLTNRTRTDSKTDCVYILEFIPLKRAPDASS